MANATRAACFGLKSIGKLEAEQSNNNQMVRIMKRKITSLALIALLITGSISQMACGNATTIDRVGRVAVALAKGFSDEVAALKTAGLMGPKIDAAEKAGKKITAAAASLQAILDGAKTINSHDAAQIAGYISTISGAVGGLLQDPNFLGLGENSTIVKITKYTSIALTQLSLTLGAFFPPPTPGQVGISSADTKVVKTSAIKVQFPEPPAEVKALLK